MKCRRLVAFLVLAVFSQHPFAQDIKGAFRELKEFKPVAFETEIKASIGTFTSLSNTTFRPAGPGPFPAVVLMHTCGGIQNPHMREHGKELLERGFVVLMLDSFEPRGMKNCSGGTLSTQAGVVDAYAALAFLAKQDFVDAKSIFQIGYSWGGLVATLLASPQSAMLAQSPLRFRATVSNYSTCTYKSAYTFVLKDIDRPVLMLLGERDQELPPASCFPMLDELKAAGVPVQWKMISGATHGWDKRGQSDKGYVYNQGHANEATDLTFKFLSQDR